MPQFPRPIIVISRCIDFDACRYNGQIIRASLREELEPHVSFEPICPELEIGLGVPRDPIRIVHSDDGARLLQPSTRRDLTDAMRSFSSRYLGAVGEVDGFILKSRSPSCAVGNARVHPSERSDEVTGTAPGMFAEHVLERFPLAAVEDEGRLQDMRIRDRFLTRAFALAAVREQAGTDMESLVGFHARNELLLMVHGQAGMRAAGRIVANARNLPFGDVVSGYRDAFASALARPARAPAHVNAMQHAFGHLSERLSAGERSYFHDLLDAFRGGSLHVSAPLGLLRSWAERFDHDYLRGQTYLAPYPSQLVRLERREQPQFTA